MMIPLPHGLGQLHRRNWIVVASWPGTAWWYGTESLCIPNRHDTGSTSPRSVGEVALVPGERGVLLCVALDQRVAKIILDYAEASFERSPILKQLIASRTADALELTNGITLEVRPASFRKLRGPTYVAVIADELAFWYVDTAYANPDVEILNAVEPGLATTGGPLILASSPHARRGVLWDVFRRHYLAEFRTDVEGFVALEVVESCVGDHREMLPATGVTYRAFVDPSGGSEDAMTLAIAHGSTRPDERVIVERHRVDQPTISGRSRANLGHYKPLFACDDCTFSSGRRCAFFTGESTSRRIAMSLIALTLNALRPLMHHKLVYPARFGLDQQGCGPPLATISMPGAPNYFALQSGTNLRQREQPCLNRVRVCNHACGSASSRVPALPNAQTALLICPTA